MKRTGRSKTRTAKGITACKRRRRCLSFKSRAATTVEQREGHHGSLYGSPTSMRASQAVDWNVTQARNSNASQGHHTRRLALDPCVTTMSHVQRARSTSSSPYCMSSSGWPLTLVQSAMQASAAAAVHASSSSNPTGTRRHGRRSHRKPSSGTFCERNFT